MRVPRFAVAEAPITPPQWTDHSSLPNLVEMSACSTMRKQSHEACQLRSLADQIIESQMAEDLGSSQMRGMDVVGAPEGQAHGPPSGRHRRLI
jgi:hypothetical protein